MSHLTVKIVRSEKREVDELDTKPFTMYVLEVRGLKLDTHHSTKDSTDNVESIAAALHLC